MATVANAEPGGSSIALVRPSAGAIRRARRRYRLRRDLTAYLFLAPALALFIAFLLIPVLWVARQTFMEGGVLGPAQWVGFKNWDAAFRDPEIVRSLVNTLKFTVLIVPTVIVLGLCLALLMRPMARAKGAVRVATYLPSLAPIVLVAIIWTFMVHPDFGLLNLANRTAGLAPLNFIGDRDLAFLAVASMEVWRGFGFWALFLLAALLGISRELYQAAEVDGAGPWQRFRFVTLPSIRGPLVVAVILQTIVTLQMFDPVFILTQGGPGGATQTAVFNVYTTTFETGNAGFGAVLSLILLAVIVVITAVLMRVLSGRRRAANT